MAIKGEVLDALLAAGATAEMIVAAVKADAAEDERKLARKREIDAARQRRHRSSRNVTRTRRDPPIEKIIPPVSSDEETGAGRKSHPEKPDDVSDPVWRDFTAHRVRQKAPVSETAMAGIRREAAKAGWTLEAALAECVTRGWRAFKAEWVEAKSAANDGYLEHLAARHASGP